MPRASGKTTLLIKESAKTGRPIIEPNAVSARYVSEQANEMGLKIPDPIVANQLERYRDRYAQTDEFLIDELDSVLATIFGKRIGKVTYTPEKMSTSISCDRKMDTYTFNEALNQFEIVLDNIQKWLDQLPGNMNSEKEGKRMGKFKVGDVVWVKPVEELKKSYMYGKSLDCFEKTIHKVSGIRIGYYDLEGCEGVLFDDSMLEYYEHTEGNIFSINVIVPDKVVEIEFYDGKEKMVCHKDDAFDLRKCCFIAIAKHLYKREYTYEGIEYMAEQLMYQKKYVKIVDRAMKEYQKLEEEKAKKIREEEEEKIIRARQRARRWKKKQRRIEQREAERNEALKAEREEMVSMMAEAINRAKDERKKSKE